MLTALGDRFGDETAPDDETLVAAIRDAADAVQRLGRCQPGDKTMLDALLPFAETLAERLAAGDERGRGLVRGGGTGRGGGAGNGGDGRQGGSRPAAGGAQHRHPRPWGGLDGVVPAGGGRPRRGGDVTAGPTYLGIDAGTSVVKAVLLDETGAALVVNGRDLGLQHGEGDRVEQDADEVLRAVGDVVGAVLEQARAEGRQRPDLVAVTAQGDGCWLVDADHQPVRPAVSWLDGRAADLVADWTDAGITEKVYRLNGTTLFPGSPAPILAWLDRHEPDVLDRADRPATARTPSSAGSPACARPTRATRPCRSATAPARRTATRSCGCAGSATAATCWRRSSRRPRRRRCTPTAPR